MEPVGILCSDLGVRPVSRSMGIVDILKRAVCPPTRSDPIRYGARVANATFCQAMASHLDTSPILLIAPSENLSSLQWQLSAISRSSGENIKIVDYPNILNEIQVTGCSGWIDAEGLFSVPFDLRSLSSQTVRPVLFTHHTVSYAQEISRNFLPLLLSNTLPCDSLVCSSFAAKRQIEKIMNSVRTSLASQHNANVAFNGRMDVIPFGVDTEKFRPLQNKEQIRRRHGIPHCSFVLLYLGRISPIDKADLLPLFQALSEVSLRNPSLDIRFVIGGQSTAGCEADIRRAAKDLKVNGTVFLGNIPDASLVELYNAADVFVSPADSVQECFGLTPVEAMACGLPQIVSNWSGYGETVLHNVTGFLVPTIWAKCDDDLGSLARIFNRYWDFDHFYMAQSVALDMKSLIVAIETLARNPDMRFEMSVASRRRAVAEFDWKVVVRRYTELLAETRAIAENLRNEAKDKGAYRAPEFYATSNHFATMNITGEELVATSKRKSWLSITYDDRYPSVTRRLPLRTPRVHYELARFCRPAKPFRQVVEHVRRVSPRSREEAIREVMWCLKYDVLELLDI